MNTYRVIDESRWKRATHCAVFREAAEPMFCVTFELDVTRFLNEVKTRGDSFTFSLIHTVTKCASEIEEFRYRFVGGQVVLFDRVDTSFTYLNAQTELFKVVRAPMCDSRAEYLALAEQTARQQTEYFTGPPEPDVFMFSPLPWVPYTHISHTNSGKKEQATPLFDWGKYVTCNGRILLPFSVQVHHSFVDGLHIGKLYETLQAVL